MMTIGKQRRTDRTRNDWCTGALVSRGPGRSVLRAPAADATAFQRYLAARAARRASSCDGHQLSVLTYLRGQSVTMRELARELAVGESAATAVVDRLVRQELVVRCDDPSDRRLVRLALSGTGESLVTKLHATACQRQRIFSCRSPTTSSPSSSRPWRCSTLLPSRTKHLPAARALRRTTPRRSRQDDDHPQDPRCRPSQRPPSGR